jgi:Na+/H+-dicarboxylate symporter
MAESSNSQKSLLGRWNAIPLYFRILLAMLLGLVVGIIMGERAAFLEMPSRIILQLLGALAPPLILVAVIHVLMTSEITGKMAARLVKLLLLNTMVAITIGLAVANIMQPGKFADIPESPVAVEEHGSGPLGIFLDSIPKSLVGPISDESNVIGVIFIAIAFEGPFDR